LKILLDQGLPVGSALLLRAVGYDCRHVAELGMQQAEDEQILSTAAELQAVLITLDADFHALVAVHGLLQPSVVRLRLEGCRAEAVVRILQPLLIRYERDLERGCLVSVKEKRIAVHRLPIGKRNGAS